MKNRLLSLIVLMLFGFGLLAQEGARFIPNMNITSSKLEMIDWPTSFYKEDLDPSGMVAFSDQGDLDFEYSFLRIGERLLVAVKWKDDVLDVKRVPYDSVRWYNPETKGQMDRMYLYDGLRLRISVDTVRVDAWLMPQSIDDQGLIQWQTLKRGKDNQEARTVKVIGNEFVNGQSELLLELSLGHFPASMQAGEEFEINLTVIDQDHPEMGLAEKFKELKYIYKKRTYRLD